MYTPSTPTSPAVLTIDHDDGWLDVEVKAADGTPQPVRLDLYESYYRYADRVREAADREAAAKAWAAEVLGVEVSTSAAVRLSHVVVDRFNAVNPQAPTETQT